MYDYPTCQILDYTATTDPTHLGKVLRSNGVSGTRADSLSK
jgi:hypothetical protein